MSRNILSERFVVTVRRPIRAFPKPEKEQLERMENHFCFGFGLGYIRFPQGTIRYLSNHPQVITFFHNAALFP